MFSPARALGGWLYSKVLIDVRNRQSYAVTNQDPDLKNLQRPTSSRALLFCLKFDGIGVIDTPPEAAGDLFHLRKGIHGEGMFCHSQHSHVPL